MVEDSDNIRKKAEFDAFIKAINEGQVGHWIEIANALNVTDDTITAWKKLPEAQEAIKKGIDHALQCMQQAGARDWRMWESKLKMLGLNPASNVNVKVDDPRTEILRKYLGEDDAGKTKEASG
jgi:hypothetical protein